MDEFIPTIEHQDWPRDDSADRLCRSVATNLELILNTRQGTLVHEPDYGMPEPNFNGDRGAELRRLKRQIAFNIKSFEPRIRGDSIRIEIDDHVDNGQVVARFSIRGRCGTDQVRAVAEFVRADHEARGNCRVTAERT